MQVESGVQLFSRISPKNNLNGINPKIFPNGGPNINQIIEVVFETEGEGPDLLIDFIVRCILPTSLNEEWKGCGAILINTTFQINLMNIIKIMNAYLKKHGVSHVKAVIEKSLRNLTLLNAYSLEQTKLTFSNLEKILQQKDNVALLVVDSISSHYWYDKMSNQMLSFYQHSKKMFDLLYNVTKNLNLTLFFARNEKEITKKSLSPNIDYKIIVQKVNKHDFQALVLDFSKQSEVSINFCVNVFVEFR